MVYRGGVFESPAPLVLYRWSIVYLTWTLSLSLSLSHLITTSTVTSPLNPVLDTLFQTPWGSSQRNPRPGLPNAKVNITVESVFLFVYPIFQPWVLRFLSFQFGLNKEHGCWCSSSFVMSTSQSSSLYISLILCHDDLYWCSWGCWFVCTRIISVFSCPESDSYTFRKLKSFVSWQRKNELLNWCLYRRVQKQSNEKLYQSSSFLP